MALRHASPSGHAGMRGRQVASSPGNDTRGEATFDGAARQRQRDALPGAPSRRARGGTAQEAARGDARTGEDDRLGIQQLAA